MNIAEAKLHPDKVFATPHAVYKHSNISTEDKIAILLAWKNQIELLAVASEEGMLGKEDHTENIKLIDGLIMLLEKVY